MVDNMAGIIKASKIQNIKQQMTGEVIDPKVVLIEASKLSLNDMFMHYNPSTITERKLQEELSDIIQYGINDFYKVNCDPSFNDEWNDFIYESGKMPAIGKSKFWWEMRAHEHGGRLGKRREYTAFLGVLIKKLIESGKTPEEAWYEVCVDSKKLGNYVDADGFNNFENTASREICGFCDLSNVYKILEANNAAEGIFYLGGSHYLQSGTSKPLYSITSQNGADLGIVNAVGWIVFDKK